MHAGEIRQLNNHYVAMRHGHSEANAAGIVVSKPQLGCGGFGLTAIGYNQVRDSVAGWIEAETGLHILSSDFLRARQTAELVHQRLEVDTPIVLTEDLRERDFGALDGQTVDAYARVWTADARDPNHSEHGVEPASAVIARVTALLQRLERQYCGAQILLVSHGDVLQLLQTVFAGIAPGRHRELPHLDVAEIRRLNPD